jgi:hypothetical protein
MSEFDFADRYAEAGIAPKAELIEGRKQAAERIAKNITKDQTFDLVSLFYGLTPPDVTWFRDEFRKEDVTFSLVQNERECVILAAMILGKKVAAKQGLTILSIVTTWTHGKRTPAHADWLLADARSALQTHAAEVRKPKNSTTEIKAAFNPKVVEDLAAVGANDFNALLQALGKVRNEAQATATSLAAQVSAALSALNSNEKFLREESQILWWLFGEHSRTLNRNFSAIRAAQAALVAGIELGELSIASILGPVAAPAVLERVLRLARKDKQNQPVPTLKEAIDGIGEADLSVLKIPSTKHPFIFPMLTAIAKAKEAGIGSWGGAFQKATMLEPGLSLEPMDLALQTYHEHLLGQL